jgi:hypothetical protein
VRSIGWDLTKHGVSESEVRRMTTANRRRLLGR